MARPFPSLKPSSAAACLCGSGRLFGICCEPLLRGLAQAETAEALMRSRYSAHSLGESAYLHRTDYRTAKVPYVPQPEEPPTRWTGLTIHRHELAGGPDRAIVEFTATFDDEGTPRAMRELSEFVREGGRWYYTKARKHEIVALAKAGRNDPCSCGSGKKFKSCCGK